MIGAPLAASVAAPLLAAANMTSATVAAPPVADVLVCAVSVVAASVAAAPSVTVTMSPIRFVLSHKRKAVTDKNFCCLSNVNGAADTTFLCI